MKELQECKDLVSRMKCWPDTVDTHETLDLILSLIEVVEKQQEIIRELKRTLQQEIARDIGCG